MKLNTAGSSNRTFAARIALGAVKAYQILISPYFTGSCRFVPSCSEYACEAIELHGAGRGSWLALRRLLRCHPLCSAGHDPVPTYRDR